MRRFTLLPGLIVVTLWTVAEIVVFNLVAS